MAVILQIFTGSTEKLKNPDLRVYNNQFGGGHIILPIFDVGHHPDELRESPSGRAPNIYVRLFS